MFSKLSLIVCAIFFIGNVSSSGKMYHKEYHNNGKIKSEGWLSGKNKVDYWKFYHMNGKKFQQGHFKNGQRIGYWHFYHENGKLEMEGHYKNNKKANWWLFYNQSGKIIHKCQLHDGIKNGYCLKYKNEKLASAEKYKNGQKIKEWFSFRSFKKENKLSDLR